jgi:putative oxidoreductase
MSVTTANPTSPFVATLVNLAAPLGRLLLAGLFIQAGWGKIAGYAGTAAYMASAGLPSYLLPLVILTELGGGILLVLGWQTRIVAFLIAGFTVLTSLIFHANVSDQMQMLMFMKNMSITGGLLMIVAHGAGAFSLDARRG